MQDRATLESDLSGTSPAVMRANEDQVQLEDCGARMPFSNGGDFCGFAMVLRNGGLAPQTPRVYRFAAIMRRFDKCPDSGNVRDPAGLSIRT